MTDYMRDYNAGGFATALAMAHQPIWGASSAANYLICEARQVDLVEADRQKIRNLATEMEATAKALRSAADRRDEPVLMQAAE